MPEKDLQEILLKLNDHDHELGSAKHRLDNVEADIKEYGSLVRAVDKLATNMGQLCEEQQKQGKRLERLEQAPADDFKHYKRLIIGYVFTATIGLIMGAIFALIFK